MLFTSFSGSLVSRIPGAVHCYELMRRSGIHSLDSLMLNGEGILIQLQGADIREKTGQHIH
ncbi:hypothetical protein [Escherichia coli]|uniref:hypothetical protein n=1 Tax=Escherichia coli TaxID=562 RepID=UPI00207BDF08|nr:hypothetical protein [Escherichia coli]